MPASLISQGGVSRTRGLGFGENPPKNPGRGSMDFSGVAGDVVDSCVGCEMRLYAG